MSNRIDVIGLGAGDLDQLPLGLYKKLTGYKGVVYTRTEDHPVIEDLKEEGVSFHSFDELYVNHNEFGDVYEHITASLLEAAKQNPVLFTVPGHPMLAEKTVQLLLEQEEVEVAIRGGQSYLDDLFSSLKIDPIEGFQFLDATSFERSQLEYRHHIVFCQVYDHFVASEVKLALLEDLPYDYPVTIVEAAGTGKEKIRTIPLEELDHSLEISNLTSVYVPPVSPELLNHTFTRLREVIAALRAPDGCPWDREQTHESLREYAIEEVYELIDAIDEEDDENLVEELGDVLLQVMLHSQIGEDNGYFMVDDVIRTVTDKMIHRHPHVFGNKTAESVEEVYKNWDQLKKEEKGDVRKSVLDGVPGQLPSLAKAFKLQKKAAKVGFGWEDAEDIWLKLEEELQETRDAIDSGTHEEVENELGDVLFVLANIARYYKVNPEVALNRTNRKFISRFGYVEEQINQRGKNLKESSLEEMDALWNEAKERE
ncbi:bifunctional methyltransferase/pyrophosphohydrolase YabN [Virgibacillus sediminis]|uniref:Nucleoside triphosphate pyrophosphohydrolase n=1 Tax=Virgibacillus sediminis TaxID=202260 RepID=A0ABV7A6X7_9BACI